MIKVGYARQTALQGSYVASSIISITIVTGGADEELKRLVTSRRG